MNSIDNAIRRHVAGLEQRVAELERERDGARAEAHLSAQLLAQKGREAVQAAGALDACRIARERSEADNAAFREDSRRGMLLWHGSHCEMSGGAYPENPSECVDRQCRTWAARLAAPHPGAALLERALALEVWVTKAVRGFRNLTEIGVVGGEYADEALRIAQEGVDVLKERKP